MTGVVFAVSVLLVLAGAVSIISGAPIVQIERGWTEVIAGAVAVSGGAVTFALGAVLVRLQALDRTIRTVSRPSAEPERLSSLESEPLRPTRTPEEPVFVADPEPEASVDGAEEPAAESPAARDRASRWQRRELPAPIAPSAEDEPLAALHDEATAADAPEPLAEAIVPPVVSSAVAEQPDDRDGKPRRLLAPASDLSAVEVDTANRSTSYSRDWLTRPLLRSRETRVEPPDPPPLFAGPPDRDEADAPTAPEIHVSGPEESDASEEREAPPTDPLPDPVAAEVSVIGRYQAGASSYTMYSDGAIDVATEGGDVHRFDSMDELKAFIARQEDALS